MQTPMEYEYQYKMFGPCQIEVPYKGVLGIFVDEVLSPFYIFQVGSIFLWMFDTYYYYASAIILMTIISAVVEIFETRRNLLNVRSMAMYECPVNVLRPKEKSGGLVNSEYFTDFSVQTSSSLVPGDIIEVPSGKKMPCDCVLLCGGVVVNEAMLTGESIPVLRTALPFNNDIYNPDEDKKYTIFSGTEVLQSRQIGEAKVCALVIRTGFATVKGSLVRYILYPKETKFSFYSDSYKYIAFMFCLSFLGMGIQLLQSNNLGIGRFIKKCLDLITITVPPALPAAMSAGITYALSRLKKKQIYCISPPRVNMAGKLDVFCFDKTGTLTEEGLSIFGYRVGTAVSEAKAVFSRFYPNIKDFQNPLMYTHSEFYEKKKDCAKSLFVECLASCHGITRVGGKLIGDPLDIEMFNDTGWILDEPDVGGENANEMISAFVMPNGQQNNYDWENEGTNKLRPYQLGIIRRFDFSSKLQRMSVIVQNLRDSKYRLFTKGSPEKIIELSKKETIPNNFQEILSKYTQKGCRVLGMGTRDLNINYQQCQKVGREVIEKKLQFLGFLILQNKLKPVTTNVITKLQKAGIRTVMATGDNIYTAISVARQCGIILNNHTVFLGDLTEKDGKKAIEWTQVEQYEECDESYLKAFEEEKVVDSNHAMENRESNIIEYIPRKISDSLQYQIDRSSKGSIRSKLSIHQERKLTLLSDVDGSEHDFNKPWEDIELPYSIAFTGKAFEFLLKHDPTCKHQNTRQLLKKIAVLARVSPDGKALLVDALQNQGSLVGMCGDGANDCVALKAADVGISLSDAEASIAAPFTSKIPDIACVLKLLKEGRAALATSFQCFKYMGLYSMIQFVSVSIMYSMERNLTDSQYLLFDLFWILPLAFTMSWTEAAKGLSKQQPPSSLICIPVLTSMIGQVIIQGIFQVIFAIYKVC